jgi:hypothetical protein
MNRMYLRNARKTIRRHGVFIQGVLAESPLDEPWTYSVGFQLLDPPRPEVIIVGVEVHSAGRLVNEVYKRVRDGTAALQPGELLSDFEGFPDTVRLRVDPVLAQWQYGLDADAGFEVELAAVPGQPFQATQTPVRLRTRGRLVRNDSNPARREYYTPEVAR